MAKTEDVVVPTLSGLAVAGPIGAGIGSIIGAVSSWYGASEQRKENQRTRDAQERYFNEQMGWEKEQYAGNLAQRNLELQTTTKLTRAQMRAQERAQAESERMDRRKLALSTTQNQQQFGLATEAQKANIDLGNRGMALQEKQVETEAQANKFNQIAQLMTNMTQFYNSPAARQNLSMLYRGYRR